MYKYGQKYGQLKQIEKSIIMSLGKRVKEIREEKGWTQADLAKKIGVSQQTIQKIENKKTKASVYILELAAALGVDPYWLKEGKKVKLAPEKLDYLEKTLDYISIPLLNDADVVAWVRSGLLPENSQSINMIGILTNISKKAFYMEVKNSAMVSIYNAAHSYYPGEVILVDPEKAPHPGSVVVALLNGKDLKIRKYEQDGDAFLLKAYDNANYPNIPVDEKVEILGVVVQKTAVTEKNPSN